MNAAPSYNILVGLRKAAWVFVYAAVVAGVDALLKHLSADQALSAMWWIPPVIGLLTLAGNALRFYRRSP